MASHGYELPVETASTAGTKAVSSGTNRMESASTHMARCWNNLGGLPWLRMRKNTVHSRPSRFVVEQCVTEANSSCKLVPGESCSAPAFSFGGSPLQRVGAGVFPCKNVQVVQMVQQAVLKVQEAAAGALLLSSSMCYALREIRKNKED